MLPRGEWPPLRAATFSSPPRSPSIATGGGGLLGRSDSVGEQAIDLGVRDEGPGAELDRPEPTGLDPIVDGRVADATEPGARLLDRIQITKGLVHRCLAGKRAVRPEVSAQRGFPVGSAPAAEIGGRGKAGRGMSRPAQDELGTTGPNGNGFARVFLRPAPFEADPVHPPTMPPSGSALPRAGRGRRRAEPHWCPDEQGRPRSHRGRTGRSR